MSNSTSPVDIILNGESTLTTIARAARDQAVAAAAAAAQDAAITNGDVSTSTANAQVANEQALIATQAKVDTETARNAAQAARDTATAQATTATTQAGIATTQATTATTQADVATTQATSATASAVAAAADRAQTGLDRTQTGLDRTATAADRVQTGLDRVQTGQDRTATAADAAATGQDRIATGQDRAATGQDRVQTGQDRTSATGSATSAANSASTATTQAGIATTQATAAATSRTQAEAAVASVTVGSTNSLAYPEQVRSLITATDVVDVMIYDTRLDSDGGAWTERCSGTPWFNETLNTASRGAKRAFPKVALIVLRENGSAGAFAIYDALDLDPVTSVPRLWGAMTGGTHPFTRTATTNVMRRVFALNGQIWIVMGGTAGRFVHLDMPAGTAAVAGGVSSPLRGLFTFGVQSAGTLQGQPWVGAPTFAVGRDLTDVHATVLPGAQVNPVSGLPVPTVVFATTGGFAVLHPDQRVANVTLAGLGHLRARFTQDNRIAAIIGAPSLAEIGLIPYVATTASTAWRTHRIGQSGIGATGGIILPDAVSASPLTDILDSAVAQVRGLSLIAEDAGNAPNSMVASIGPAHNSGWMPSTGIQLATLAEGVTGSVTGTANLITNGDFATDLGGWTVVSCTQSGGALVMTPAPTVSASVDQQVFGLVVGETYRYEVSAVTGPTITLAVSGTALGGTGLGTTTMVAGTRGVVQFVATATFAWLRIFLSQGNGPATVDDASLQLVAADQSHRRRGLNVIGTLSRTAVGTGNDVVGWSGFDAANYLTQPSNAALAVATGDVMVAAWVNVSSFAAAFPIALAQGSDAIQLGVTAATGFNFRLQSSTAATDLTVNGNTQPTGQWAFVVGLRRAGLMELWVNGVREATLAAAGTLTATPGALEVGRSANASVMGAAMLRVATYAPTPAQIERMFRDERPLFQPEVKAFLGGASNATVRRISRSRFTNRLAVSMSDGLTVMDGLQRVERHTTATLSPAMASNSVTPVAMESGLMLIGTASNAGVRRDAVVGLDRLPSNQPTLGAPRLFRARGVTTDATPLTIAPRIHIGERETVVVTALIVARVYGASDTERLTYQRRATYFRDAGGNVTLAGAVQVIGSDVETTGTADATLALDITAQTVAAQVTGIAATRLVWTVRYQIERTTQETSYEEVV